MQHLDDVVEAFVDMIIHEETMPVSDNRFNQLHDDTQADDQLSNGGGGRT